MTNPTEAEIEQLAIRQFERLGYRYLYGPDCVRNHDEEVILRDELGAAIGRINPTMPVLAQQQAMKEIEGIVSPDLLTNNETFHRLLTEGVKVNYSHEGYDRGDLVWLIDFARPANNDFLVVNQWVVTENQQHKRLDVVLFVNGLPLVVMELKSAVREKATLQTAYQQLESYKHLIPSLFTYNALLIISDGIEAKAGSLSARYSRFMAWKHGRAEIDPHTPQLETLINELLNPVTLLDFVRHFVVFEKGEQKERKTGIITISTEKKVAAYHQYYAVNKAVESTLRAVGVNIGEGLQVREDPINYGLPSVERQPHGDRKGGVIWHTQGSGKSLSMVFYVGKIVLALDNPTILVITDRNDLDDQLFDTFAASKQLLRQEPQQVENRAQLKKLLSVAAGGVIFSTIQKFQPEEGNVYEQLSDRSNIVVIADEAHRTQYGFQAKIITAKSEEGQKLVYGFAKYLRDALPNATYLGFTGTPIEKTDVNTPAVFGHYVDIYDIAQSVHDGATVRIYYESRLAKMGLSEAGRNLVATLDAELEQEDLSATQKAKAKWTQLEALVGSEGRIRNIAQDIIDHFEQRQAVFEGKGMIITMSRRIAADLYAAIVALRPEWHSDDKLQGAIKVVMTANSDDGEKLARHHTTKEERRKLAGRMKEPHDALKLVIVCDMWLTGFDVPSLHTLYMDKAMKGHNLMQAIARVNRVYKDKPSGLVVDYLGIAADLREALAFYVNSGGRGDPMVAQAEAVAMLQEWLEVVRQMFHGFAYWPYFEANTSEKLRLLLAAQNFILGLDEGQTRFIQAVTGLSRLFVIAIPHEAALAVKDEVAFFQAIKARLLKFEPTGGGKSNEELETAIRQVIDEALVSHEVVDVFDAAGIKKPDMSILSEEFLAEMKGMAHQNLALEVLNKLLHDELKARAKKNLVQSKSLMELLEVAIRKYHTKMLTAVEVINELIELSKEIQRRDAESAHLGLSDFEYAFYTAVADNESARELMQKDKLRELAVVLTQKVRANASIDWTLKESVRAKLKVMVKRTLREFGYPPDMQALATDMVLKQAEAMAAELTGEW